MKKVQKKSQHKEKTTSLQKQRKLVGFTLIELMISVFIFLLIMTATVTIFTREITAYRVARETQKNLENAQFTFNFLAKTLRTSEVNDFSSSKLYAYDHSQNKCFIFTFTADALMMQKQADGTTMQPGLCRGTPPSMEPDVISLTIGDVTGSFRVKRSNDGTEYGEVNTASVGAVTTILLIEPEGGARTNVGNAEKLSIQTTVSLRDYPNAGIDI